MAIGILGGTFNPIHIGHLIIAQEAKLLKNLQKIIFIPAKQPPLKESLTTAEHRYNMVCIAIKDNPSFEVSDIEMQREGKSYTYDTIIELKKNLQDDLMFILGSDKIPEIPKWYKWQELLQQCDFVFVGRPDFNWSLLDKIKNFIPSETFQRIQENVINPCLMSISSSLIRYKCQKSQSIEYFVTKEVKEYIKENSLYKDD